MTLLEVTAIVISVIALVFTGFKDFILPFIFRPRVYLEGQNDAFCIHDTKNHLPRGFVDARWVRLRIKNVGRFTVPARGCYVKILEIIDPTRQVITPFSPSLLTWVGYDSRKENLAKNEEHYIDLVNKSDGATAFEISKVAIPNALAMQTPSPFSKMGMYTFRIGIYGDNITGEEHDIKVIHKAGWQGLEFH